MYKRYLTWLVVVLVCASWLMPAMAQEDENEGVAEVIMITPKAGKGPELEAAIRDFHHWVADNEGSFRYNWFIIETGPNTGSYVARTGDHNWADFDQEFDWQEEADQKFMTDVMPLIEHAERYLTQEIKELAHWPEDFTGYGLFQIEQWYVKPGQFGKFRAGLEKVHKALSEANYGQYYGWVDSVSGGKSGQITLVLPYRNYADMTDEDPSFYQVVSEALGGPEAFENHMQDFGTTYHVGETYLLRYLPEASDYCDAE